MRKIKAWKSERIAVALFLALFFAGPVAAGGHDVDPVFFFVSDELLLTDETIEELCISEGDFGSWWLVLSLKPKEQERMRVFTAAHVNGWLVLAARDKVLIKARIMEPISGRTHILLLSADTSEELEETLRTSFGIAEPQICPKEKEPFQ